MKTIYKIILSSIFLFFCLLVLSPLPAKAQEEPFNEETLEATVTEIVDENSFNVEGITQYSQKLRLEVTRGSLSGRTIEIDNGGMATANSQKYKIGDKLLIAYTKDLEGNDLFFVADYVRRDKLLFLFAVFCLLTIVVGRIWGATSLLGMAISFGVIFYFILPQILAGKNPVYIAVLGSVFIIPFTFSFSHGLKTKTLIAAVSTVITLIIVGLMAGYFIDLIHLTGFSGEESSILQFDVQNVLNMKGILLAGIIIASLGILDDITISQASVVAELKDANKSYGFRKLFNKGMNVGRDHIASLVNTLVLVYTGASLPLLLLFLNNTQPFSEIVNYEIIAEEVVRTLVGSMGLILAVPLTTVIAAYYFNNKKV